MLVAVPIEVGTHVAAVASSTPIAALQRGRLVAHPTRHERLVHSDAPVLLPLNQFSVTLI